MKRMGGLLGILLVALLAFSTDVPPARWAFASSGVIVVNNGCAASPTPTPSTGQQVTYVDQNGNVCVNTGGGSGGSSLAPVVSASVESNHVLKASAGSLVDVYVTAGSTAGYLMVFNATSAPVDGAVTPQDCVSAPANQTTSIFLSGTPSEAFATGITAVFSSTGCFTKTASATAFFHGRVQ